MARVCYHLEIDGARCGLAFDLASADRMLEKKLCDLGSKGRWARIVRESSGEDWSNEKLLYALERKDGLWVIALGERPARPPLVDGPRLRQSSLAT